MQHLNDDVIEDYLSDSLPPAQRAIADAHLLTCAECRRRLGAERSFQRLIELDAVAVLPPEAYQRISLALAARLYGTRRRALLRRTLALLAGAVLGVIAGAALRTVAQSRAFDRELADLGVTPQVRQEVVERLAALRALEEEPWLLNTVAYPRTALERAALEPGDSP